MASPKRPTPPSRAEVRAGTPDPAVGALLDHAAEAGFSTVFDRFDAQQPQCGHGLSGLCCRICHMGPCRITPRASRGVCGADADLIVARNLLRWLAGGVASHGARGREVMLALKAAAEGRLPQEIRGAAKVKAVARAFGLDDGSRSVEQLAGAIADLLLEDLSRTVPGDHRTLHTMAPPERIARWRELDILPIGAQQEVFEALHRTGVGTDGDWQSVMRQFLRLGLAFAWSSVLGSSIAMDCLYGLPRRSRIATNVGAIQTQAVNIALHGHSPVLVSAIVEAADAPDLVARAHAAGASGIAFYGICCSGLSALYRQGGIPPLANAVGAELVLATGAIDLWVADLQDVYPGLMEIAHCLGTKVVTTSESAALPGALALGYDHRHGNLAETPALARRIVELALEAHSARRAVPRHLPPIASEAEIGFSVEALGEAFGGLGGLLAELRAGRVRGIVNLVGCNNPKVLYEAAISRVADHLLAHDVLVLTNGCASFPLLKLGYCLPEALERAGPGLNAALGPRALPPVLHMGECLDNARASGLFRALADAAGQPLHALPFAFASPEWSNEKGVGAALGFRLMGLDSYHCVAAPVSGSAAVARFLDQGSRELFGGGMVVEPDPEALARRLIADLDRRRTGLGWPLPTVPGERPGGNN